MEPKIDQKRVEWFERVKDKYGEMIEWIFRHRKKAFLLFASFLGGSILLFQTQMRFILFPYNDVDIFYVIAELPEGTPFKTTEEKMKPVEELVSTLSSDEMTSYTTRIGHHNVDVYRSEDATSKENHALITVYLKLSEERERTSEVIMAEFAPRLANSQVVLVDSNS